MQIESEDISTIFVMQRLRESCNPDEKAVLVRGIPAKVERAWAMRKLIAIKKSFEKEG